MSHPFASCFTIQPFSEHLTSSSFFHPAPTHPCHLLPQHLSSSISPFLLHPSLTVSPAHPQPHTWLGCASTASLQEAASLTYCVFIRKSCKRRKHLKDKVLMQYLLTSAMHQSLGTSKGEGFFSNEDHSQGALMHAVLQSQEADHKQLEIISHCQRPWCF